MIFEGGGPAGHQYIRKKDGTAYWKVSKEGKKAGIKHFKLARSAAKKSPPKKSPNTKISIPYIVGHREVKTITKGVLTVAAYPHFYPVCYTDKKGNLTGLDVDLIKNFAQQAGLKIKFIAFQAFNNIWLKPEERVTDLAIGGIGNAKGRGGKNTEWTIPYFYVQRSTMSLKTDPIKKFPQDVHGVLIGTFGSTGWLDGEIRLKEHRKGKLMIKGTSDEEDISKLLSGKVQGLMRGDFVSRAIIQEHPELGMTTWEASPKILPKDGEVFAFPTLLGSGIATMLSVYITEIIDSGEIYKIMKKYHLL